MFLTNGNSILLLFRGGTVVPEKKKIGNFFLWDQFFLNMFFGQSVNFGRHLTEILSPFEISYQIFIHTLPYLYLSFRNLPYQKSKIVLLEILPYQFLFSNARKLYLINLLRSLWIDSMLTWPNDDVNCRSAVNKTKEASHWTSTRIISNLL